MNKNTSISELGLSVRSANALMRNGINTLGELLACSEEQLLKLRNMGRKSLDEILSKTSDLVLSPDEADEAYIAPAEPQSPDEDEQPEAESGPNLLSQVQPVEELFADPECREIILEYVKNNDSELSALPLSNRAFTALNEAGFKLLSDIIFMSTDEIRLIPGMTAGGANSALNSIRQFRFQHNDAIRALIASDIKLIWSKKRISTAIFKLYESQPFCSLSFEDIKAEINLPPEAGDERLRETIDFLIENKKLKCADDRFLRCYPSIPDFLEAYADIEERNRTILLERFKGRTLEDIAQDYDLTRERVRQIVRISSMKLKAALRSERGLSCFQEDYYQYLYENYAIDKTDAEAWLSMPVYNFIYFESIGLKAGSGDLSAALDDGNLDLAMRLKIKKYLNRNKINIDGHLVEKKRAAIEIALAEKFASDELSFDEFFESYNAFLHDAGLPYDENIYLTEAVRRSRYNRLSESRFILWKMNGRMRYYDIDSRDYAELLEVLSLDSYENVEISTLKFFEAYPELMAKYDILDQYELHNILKKIVPNGSFHDFRCVRMPHLDFGDVDVPSQIENLLLCSMPISIDGFIELVHSEFGFDNEYIRWNLLKYVVKYKSGERYEAEEKAMSPEALALLSSALPNDFYFISEVRDIYSRILPDADMGDINLYNLSSMGFKVYSAYILKNYPSLDAYFRSLLTASEIQDQTELKERFNSVVMFYQVYLDLRMKRILTEIAPNKTISLEGLEKCRISLEDMDAFCESVYEAAPEDTYFSITSLRNQGYYNSIFDLSFDDYFYSQLLIPDSRFSYSTIFGSVIFYKGKCDVTRKGFLRSIVKAAGSMGLFELLTLLDETYGCNQTDRYHVTELLTGSDIYYDSIQERFYESEDMYYAGP